MLTRRDAALALAALAAPPGPGPRPSKAVPPRLAPPVRLKRGVSVHNLLNWPKAEGTGAQFRFAWPPFADEAHTLPEPEIARLKATGFDFLRITVDPAIFMDSAGGRSAELSAIVADRVDAILHHGLSVVLDVCPIRRHPVFDPVAMVSSATGMVADRYTATIEQLAVVLASRPRDRVVLELMNEPQAYAPQAEAWRALQPRLAQAAWAKAPGLTLIVSGGLAGGIPGLLALDPAPFLAGPSLFSFHYYDPMAFTHQGPIMGPNALGGVSWPASRVDLAATLARMGPKLVDARAVGRLLAYAAGSDGPQTIRADFAKAAAWAQAHSIAADRLFLGEFGVARSGKDRLAAPEDARGDWLLTMRAEAERIGMAWCYWGYDGPTAFGLRDSADRLDPVTLKALFGRP